MAKPQAAGAAPANPAPASGNDVTGADDVKARIKAIMTSNEAKAFPTLAADLAYETDMPAEDAISKLKAAASDLPNADHDDTPDPAKYQASRSAAADLAQPSTGQNLNQKPTAVLNAAVARTNKRR